MGINLVSRERVQRNLNHQWCKSSVFYSWVFRTGLLLVWQRKGVRLSQRGRPIVVPVAPRRRGGPLGAKTVVAEPEPPRAATVSAVKGRLLAAGTSGRRLASASLWAPPPSSLPLSDDDVLAIARWISAEWRSDRDAGQCRPPSDDEPTNQMANCRWRKNKKTFRKAFETLNLIIAIG